MLETDTFVELWISNQAFSSMLSRNFKSSFSVTLATGLLYWSMNYETIPSSQKILLDSAEALRVVGQSSWALTCFPPTLENKDFCLQSYLLSPLPLPTYLLYVISILWPDFNAGIFSTFQTHTPQLKNDGAWVPVTEI